MIKDVYYFHAHYGFEGEVWEERDEYGFITASNFNEAMEQIVDIYRDDLMSVSVEYIGDTGVVCIKNEKIAKAFKENYIKTHYGEDE